MKRFLALILLILLLASFVTPAYAGPNIQVTHDTASLTFPETIVFNAEFQGSTNITAVVLEYGVDQLTCGTVDAKAFPQVTPGTDVKVTWTWEMRQSGSLPPGSTVWWRWLVTDTFGAQLTTPHKTILWLDDTHPWQTLTGGNINLHIYNESADFGQQLHDAAVQALQRLSKDVGVSADSPVDIYIYATTSDLQSSILFAPTWVGGQAFPENNIVIIGIPSDQLDWGKSTEAHELTHVLVGHLTFSCLGFIPTWLNEGLAMYGEGGLRSDQQALLDQAKASDTLLTLRSLAGMFSAEGTRANLSYSEAFSVVNFLIKTYGRDKMTALLLALRDGQAIDEALQTVYAFDTDGLEAAWRTSISAKAHTGSAQATPLPTPTQVPTFVPIGAAPVAAAAPATPQPTQVQAASTPPAAQPSATPTLGAVPTIPAPPGLSKSNLTTILEVALGCLVFLVIIAALVIFLIARRSQGRSK